MSQFRGALGRSVLAHVLAHESAQIAAELRGPVRLQDSSEVLNGPEIRVR